MEQEFPPPRPIKPTFPEVSSRDLGVTVGCACSERCLWVAGPEAGDGKAGVLGSSPRAPS